jgi:hypothetical protein
MLDSHIKEVRESSVALCIKMSELNDDLGTVKTNVAVIQTRVAALCDNSDSRMKEFNVLKGTVSSLEKTDAKREGRDSVFATIVKHPATWVLGISAGVAAWMKEIVGG